VNSKVLFDLQRLTSSNLSFTLGFTLGINNFLDLSLSATSENAVIFRYINNLPVFADLHPVLLDRPGDQDQYDPFLDLLDSFRFDDDARRRRSGYKMKNFKLTATHHLGDWNAVLDISLLPYLDMDALPQPAYKLNTELAFLVQWVPVSEIKSDIKYNGKNKENKWIVE
jgi:hypothetical protein